SCCCPCDVSCSKTYMLTYTHTHTHTHTHTLAVGFCCLAESSKSPHHCKAKQAFRTKRSDQSCPSPLPSAPPYFFFSCFFSWEVGGFGGVGGVLLFTTGVSDWSMEGLGVGGRGGGGVQALHMRH